MTLKEFLQFINPYRILERIQNGKTNNQIKLLCETNPQGIYDWISSGFGKGHSVEDVIKVIDDLLKDGKEININSMIEGFNNSLLSNDSKSRYALIKYAIKKDLDLDVNMLKNDIGLMNDFNIAKYVYDKGGIDAYSFCKIHKPDKNSSQYWVEQDLKCIEFDITNNPKIYEYVINSLIKEIKNYISESHEEKQADTVKQEYLEMISYLEKSKDVIFYSREKEKGKYYFPELEMYKNIRKFVERYKKTHDKENVTSDDLDELNKPFKAFYERDGFFNEEFGKKIEEIYFNDSLTLGIHNTDDEKRIEKNDDDSFLKQFFDSGLIHLADRKSATGNVAIQDELDNYSGYSLAELLYWVYDMRGKYNLIFQFPKNFLHSKDEYGRSRVIEIIDGTNEAYIPPKYIMGAYDRENPDTILITNPNFNEGNVISKEGTVIK